MRRLALFGLLALLLVSLYGFVQDKLLRAAYPVYHEKSILDIAGEYDLDPALVFAVIRTESSWRADTVSSAGARGLMQITEATFNFILVKAGWKDYVYEDLFTPEVNIRFGVFFLDYLIGDFDGITDTALAAYNAGRGSVQKWLADPRYSSDGKHLSHIPFLETRNYVKKVNAAYKAYTRLYFE